MSNPIIMTVTGAVEPDALGLTLHHEHVMSTFGADLARYPHYDAERLPTIVLPYLQYLRSLGVQSLVDCTAAYFGRHPEYLRDFAHKSGLHILTNTGYYGAANDRYVPPHAWQETADQIADRWVYEWTHGIDGTDIYPGFIKTAVDNGPLSEIDRKLIVAAARTHLRTGLTIQTHTGDNPGAVQEIFHLLASEDVHPGAWIWIHAHNLSDPAAALHAASQGAWISLDGLSAGTADHILGMIRRLRDGGFLKQVLLSHDGDSYMNGESRPYHYLLTEFIPLLTANGFSAADIRQITVDNPARAYTVQVKRGKE